MSVQTQACPSCGAPLKKRDSYFAIYICEYCKSNLTRTSATGDIWESLGKIPEPLVDASPLQIGTLGCFKGQNFEIVGRLQFHSEENVWNEWHAKLVPSPNSTLTLDNNTSAWIGDFMGLYTFSQVANSQDNLSSHASNNFEILAPYYQFFFQNIEYMVTNRDKGVCHTGEGELPQAVPKQQVFESIDCRSSQSHFLGIDLSGACEVYVGHIGYFAEFSFQNTRQFEGWK